MFKTSMSLSRNNIIKLKNKPKNKLTNNSNIILNHYTNQSIINESIKKDQSFLPNLKSVNNYDQIKTSPNFRRILRKKMAKTFASSNNKKNLFLKIKFDENSKNLNYIGFRQALRKRTIKKQKYNFNTVDINEKNPFGLLENIKDIKKINKKANQNSAEYDYSLIIKKLDNWDKDHCLKNRKDLFTLHRTLNNYYKNNNLVKEQNDFNHMNNMLEEKLNYDRYNKNKTEGILKKSTKNVNKDENENNKKEAINSLILNGLNKSYNENKIDLFNRMFKERLNYENQLQKELIFVNNIIYNKKYFKKEKNKELNILYSEIDKIRSDFDFKKNIFMKDFHKRLEILSMEQDNILSEKINEINDNNKSEQKVRKTSERKKTKREISNHLKNIEFIKKNKMHAISNEMKKGLEKISDEYQIKMKELNNKREKLEKEISMLGQELNYYKKINEELLREHQIYYLDILKKGKDCRKDGLVWVVKNLLELQMNLEYHHFPQCLTHEQINYLKKMAYLSLEENELKIILKILKRKQKANRENITIEYMNFFDTISNFEVNNKNIIYQNKTNTKETVGYDEQTLLVKHQIDKKFYKIYKNNEEAFKLYLAKSLEDEKMQNIIYYIKKALYSENNDKNGTFLKDNKISIIEAFMGKTKNKDFFGLILNINNRLKEIEKSKISIINKEKEYYLERIKNNNGINTETLDYYNNKEMIKKCLFGNKLDI